MSGWRRYYNLLSVALKHIVLDRSQAVSIAVPLAMIIAIVSAVTFYVEGVERDAFLAAESFPDILLQQQVGGRTESLLLDRYEDILKNTEGIAAYIPRVWGYINYTDRENTARAFVLMGLDPEFINSGRMLKAVIRDGRSLQKGDKDTALVGAIIANAFESDPGDVIEITTPDLGRKYALEVAGTFDSEVQIYTADLILVPIDTARKILGFYEETECSDVLLFLKNHSNAEALAQKISTSIEGARPLTKKVMLSLTELSFGQRSGYFHLLWFILLVNILIIAWSVMSRLTFNQKKEIGILKAIGWDTQDIMILKAMEVFIISSLSVISGLIAGIVYMLADAPGLKKFIIGWAEIYPDFPIPLYVEWQTVFLIVALGILPLTTATLIPIWKLSLTDPIEAIRQ